jgi:hypothetical protein
MKIFSYIISVLLWIFYFSVVVFALTESQAGTILQNFKTLEKEMLFESDTVLLDDDRIYFLPIKN